MIRSNILSSYIMFIICITCMSCVTYKALPQPSTKGARSTSSTECSPVQTSGSTMFCRTEGMYAAITRYTPVPCEEIQFESTCGVDNSGSVFWEFGDDTTSSLKVAKKTYEKAGSFDIDVVCTLVDGSQIAVTFPIEVTNNNRYRGYGVTEITPGDTSCPRIELNE